MSMSFLLYLLRPFFVTVRHFFISLFIEHELCVEEPGMDSVSKHKDTSECMVRRGNIYATPA